MPNGSTAGAGQPAVTHMAKKRLLTVPFSVVFNLATIGREVGWFDFLANIRFRCVVSTYRARRCEREQAIAGYYFF